MLKKPNLPQRKKEVIDEDEPLDEGEAQDALDASEEKLDAVSGKADELIAKLEENDEEVISGCCSAPISGELDGEYGRCSDCGEMADVIKL